MENMKWLTKINLNGDINRVKEFDNLVKNFESNLFLCHGRYVVDAKSIMGIFSLCFDQDLDLRIEEKVEGEADKLYELMKDNGFLVGGR